MRSRIKSIVRQLYLFTKGICEVYSNSEIVQLELPEVPKKAGTLFPAEMYKFYLFAEDIQVCQPKIIKTPKSWYYPELSYAIIKTNYTYDEYFQQCIKSPERALIRKAIKNRYTIREIEYDDHLDEIREINTSKEQRGGRSMSEDYSHPKKRDSIVKPINPQIYTYGCFDETQQLVAYYMFEKITNFYHVVKGIGHSEHLRNGIMNYLFAYSIAQLSEKHECEFIVYGLTAAHGEGLDRFKRQAGCQVRRIKLIGTRQQFKILKYFTKTFRLHGDVGLNYVLDYCK